LSIQKWGLWILGYGGNVILDFLAESRSSGGKIAALTSALSASLDRRYPASSVLRTPPSSAPADVVPLQAPPKQRHTARRIWQRLCAEVPGFSVGERSVRGYVRRRRQQLGLLQREVFVPQSYEWGVEAQVDWYDGWAVLGGERIKLQVFEIRSMASGGAYHRAYTHATQQAFLEAHERAFHYFDGVFKLLRYDNLKSAVKKILHGYQREETSRFIAFRSHWRFQSEFCNPARGNEKGGVEGEGGYFRRNHWVPLPEARDLEELNAYLEQCCKQDQRRILDGRTETVGTSMLYEQPYLIPLAAESFDLTESSFPPSTDYDVCACERTATPLHCRQARSSKPSFELITWKCGMKVRGSLAMSVATAVSRRSSIWNTISMCCARSPVHWQARPHWHSGARRDVGRSASIGYGRR
jgi:transposase